MLLGQRVINLRKNKGFSQETLAENASVSLRTIQRIERGKTMPRPHTLKVIAAILDTSIESLTVEDMNTAQSSTQYQLQNLEAIRLISLTTLCGLFIPFGNFIVPLFFWKRFRYLPKVNEIGSQILSFQIWWSLFTLFILLLIPILNYTFTKEFFIGRFPILTFSYVAMGIINATLTISFAYRFNKSGDSLPTILPRLF